MSGPVIGFAGLSHLGICSSVAAAAKGFSVVGFDTDADLVARMKRGAPPIVEPDLDEILASNGDCLVYADQPSALAACDVVYISRDVPTDETGQSDLTAVTHLIDAVLPHLRADVVLVVLCQVPPGFCRELSAAGRQLYYQVETLIFGRAMERALSPERFIIGGADPERAMPAAYKSFLDSFGCPLLFMRYESAELAKIAINCFLVSSVTTTNVLAEICEHIGADWEEIAPALRLDKRIGAHAYLSPGLGLGGGNLERDLATVLALAAKHGTDAGTVEKWIANSRRRRNWAYDQLRTHVLDRNPGAAIAIWGLAYKKDTASLKNSASLEFLEKLRRHRGDIRVFDPAISDAPLPGPARYADSALGAVRGADVLVIMTPWEAFSDHSVGDICTAMDGRLVIDPFGLFDGANWAASGVRHLRLGAARGTDLGGELGFDCGDRGK